MMGVTNRGDLQVCRHDPGKLYNYFLLYVFNERSAPA